MMRAVNRLRKRFAFWAIAPWILLLLAALGCLQYEQHAQYGYLLAAVVVIVVCAGCILRQAWARPVMRWMALALAAWAFVTGALMLQHTGDFERARQHALALQAQVRPLALYMIARARRTWEVGLALKALAIPMLLWLAWQLGRDEVKAQFSRRFGARSGRHV